MKHISVVYQDYTDIGCRPENPIQEILERNASILSLSKNSTEKHIDLQIVELQSATLRESIFLAYKTLALMRSLRRDVKHRDETNPELTAYTAALFIAKAILLIHGIWVSSKAVNNCYWMLDTFYTDKSLTPVIRAWKLPGQAGHRELWLTLKRLCRTMKYAPIDAELQEFIRQIDEKEISRFRHSIQYNNCDWIFDDLHGCVNLAPWTMRFDSSIYTAISTEDKNCHFSIRFLLILFRMYCGMLRAVAIKKTAISQEYRKIFDNFTASKDFCNSWIPPP